jgi:hypothetical protein
MIGELVDAFLCESVCIHIGTTDIDAIEFLFAVILTLGIIESFLLKRESCGNDVQLTPVTLCAMPLVAGEGYKLHVKTSNMDYLKVSCKI